MLIINIQFCTFKYGSGSFDRDNRSAKTRRKKRTKKEYMRMFFRATTCPNFAIRWKIKIWSSITWDLNGRKYRIRIGRIFFTDKRDSFRRYGKDCRSIRWYERNHEYFYLFFRRLSWPLAMSVVSNDDEYRLHERCCVTMCTLVSWHCLLSREKNRARKPPFRRFSF